MLCLDKKSPCHLGFIEEGAEIVSQDANKLMLFAAMFYVNQDLLHPV